MALIEKFIIQDMEENSICVGLLNGNCSMNAHIMLHNTSKHFNLWKDKEDKKEGFIRDFDIFVQ